MRAQPTAGRLVWIAAEPPSERLVQFLSPQFELMSEWAFSQAMAHVERFELSRKPAQILESRKLTSARGKIEPNWLSGV